MKMVTAALAKFNTILYKVLIFLQR